MQHKHPDKNNKPSHISTKKEKKDHIFIIKTCIPTQGKMRTKQKKPLPQPDLAAVNLKDKFKQERRRNDYSLHQSHPS